MSERVTSELEAFGRHVGEARNLEPRYIRVTCTHHPHLDATVAVLPDEHIKVCCICASADVPHRMAHFGGFGRGGAYWGLILT